MAAAQAAVEVTLRCSDHLDDFAARTFTLRPGTVVQVGRASKNTAKPELMIGPSNAYIDSPTISREHAVLTATCPPAPCVYITDKGSMHGTMVNGNKLEPQKAHRLNNGDVLQFGANVTREQLFYTARKFTFESSLPSYPHGFTVPESSDEEDVEVDEALSCPPQYGTQTNPVTIEDMEASPLGEAEELYPRLEDDQASDGDELDKDPQDTTIPLDASEETQEHSPSPDVDDHVFYPEDVSTTSPAPTRYAFVDDASSDGGAASDYSGEDNQVSYPDSCASVADSDESQSEGDMELEDNDDEEEDEVASPLLPPSPAEGYRVTPAHMQLLQLEQQNRKRLLMARQEQARQEQASHRNAPGVHENPADSPVPAITEEQGLVGIPSKEMDAARSDSSELGLSMPFTPFANLGSRTPTASKVEPPTLSETEVHIEPYFNPNGMFGDPSFDRICFGSMEAIPPRPSAPRPMQWGVLDYTSPFSPPSNPPPFPGAYSSGVLCNYPGTVEPLLPNPYAAQQPHSSSDTTWDPPKNSTTFPLSGVQTPPPAPSSDVSSPPVRRTEVSIREIVEDTTQQPPTPTSVSGGRKRKAEVLDEAVEEFDKAPSPTPQSLSIVATPDAPADVEAAPSHIAVDQRPKKRLRSRIGSAVKTAAAWVVPGVVGAAASVAFLTSVPNDFFVA